jgi:hypothetical protein
MFLEDERAAQDRVDLYKPRDPETEKQHAFAVQIRTYMHYLGHEEADSIGSLLGSLEQ